MLPLCTSTWMGFRMQTAAFYLIPSRFWQLMTGALCFELTSSARTPSDEPQPEGIPVLIWLACGILTPCPCDVWPGDDV